jgi:outer membrane protein TolC
VRYDRFRLQFARALAPVLTLSGAIFAGSCATGQKLPPTLNAEANATTLDARSFDDPGLQRFMREDAGRVTPPWDFEALAWVAFYYHPSLELARAEWQTSRAATTTAAARPNPSLTLTPGYSTNSPAGTSPWFPSVTLDFLLETAGKRERRAAAATFAAEAARLNVLSSAWHVRADLRRALIDFRAASAKLPLLQAQRETQQHLVTLLEQRRTAGSASTTDVATARTTLLRAEAAVAEAEAQLVATRGRVTQALAMPRRAVEAIISAAALSVPRPTSFTPDALATARRQALHARPDVLAALASYEAARASLEVELRRRYPDLHVGPGYQWDQGQNKWSIGVGLELPVFHRNEGPIAEAVARCRERAAQLNAVQAQIIAAIDDAAAAAPLAFAQAMRARQLRDEAHRQSERVRARFEQGAADRLEFETAQLDVRATELALVDAEAALAIAAAQLEDALRIPFDRLERLTGGARSPSGPEFPRISRLERGDVAWNPGRFGDPAPTSFVHFIAFGETQQRNLG